jgi:hypothetical protein
MHTGLVRVATLGLAGAAIAADASSGPGKLSARATRTTFSFPKFSLTECPGSVLSVELAKGLHKRLLVDPGWETSFGGSGFISQPGVSGTAWMDLDAAEAAFPGEFIGKKLTVELLMCNWTSNADGNVSLGARLDRK